MSKKKNGMPARGEGEFIKYLNGEGIELPDELMDAVAGGRYLWQLPPTDQTTIA